MDVDSMFTSDFMLNFSIKMGRFSYRWLVMVYKQKRYAFCWDPCIIPHFKSLLCDISLNPMLKFTSKLPTTDANYSRQHIMSNLLV